MSRHIDADAFLKSVKQKAYPQSGSVNESERKISLFGIMEILTAMPSADAVDAVDGEWVKITDVDIRLMGRQIKEVHYKCSVCGGESYFDTNYCPHCGTKMDLQ